MVSIIYALVVFAATFLGSFVGLGGGVIIKPMLDVINAHSLAEISFFSACAVFAMSVTSTTQHIIKKTPIKMNIVLLISLGSVTGGILGNHLFNLALDKASMPNIVKGIQSTILCALLIFIVVNVCGNFKKFHIKNPLAILISGFILGTVASFIGIGGGPINVAVLTILFSFSMKDAAVYSIAIIFFSQLASIITTYINTGFIGFDLKVLLFIIPAGIIGGLVGSRFNRKCNEKTIQKVFVTAVSSVAVLTLYNAITAFI